MIIDSHVHIGRSDKISQSLSFAQLKQTMDHYQMFQAAVMPNISSVDSCIDRNNQMLKELSDMKEDDRDYFIPIAWIDAKEKNYVEHLKSIRDDIFGIKFHPSVTQASVNDKLLEKLLKFCDNENLPILVHCGRHPISHIKYVLDASKKFKDVNFIAAHMGGNAYDIIEDALNLCKKSSGDNVFLDTSTGRHPELLKKAIKIIGDDRILFGTDLPYTNMELNFKYIEISELNSREYRNIMGYNYLKRILKKL